MDFRFQDWERGRREGPTGGHLRGRRLDAFGPDEPFDGTEIGVGHGGGILNSPRGPPMSIKDLIASSDVQVFGCPNDDRRRTLSGGSISGSESGCISVSGSISSLDSGADEDDGLAKKKEGASGVTLDEATEGASGVALDEATEGASGGALDAAKEGASGVTLDEAKEGASGVALDAANEGASGVALDDWAYKPETSGRRGAWGGNQRGGWSGNQRGGRPRGGFNKRSFGGGRGGRGDGRGKWGRGGGGSGFGGFKRWSEPMDRNAGMKRGDSDDPGTSLSSKEVIEHYSEASAPRLPEPPFEYTPWETGFDEEARDFLIGLRDSREGLICDERGVPYDDCRTSHGYGLMCQFCDGRNGPWVHKDANPNDPAFKRYQESILRSPFLRTSRVNEEASRDVVKLGVDADDDAEEEEPPVDVKEEEGAAVLVEDDFGAFDRKLSLTE